MIVDTSALVSILFGEPEDDRFLLALNRSPSRLSAASLVELGIVLDSRGAAGIVPDPARLLDRLRVSVEPVTVDQAQLAREAHRAYGRRSGHPARLNFGDCFTYALARHYAEPILCKGGDFALTDAEIAAY